MPVASLRHPDLDSLAKRTLRRLSNPRLASGKVNVVILGRPRHALEQAGGARTEYRWIVAGEAEANDSCRCGHPMYVGAGEEVVRAIEAFMLKSCAGPD